MSSLFGVEGKMAVVTGGSRGIGRMIAAGLVDAGASVVIASRKPDCEETAAQLSSAGTCVAIRGDLSTPEGARRLAAEVRERFLAIHLLVNNAGATWGAALDDFPDDAWSKVLDTNVGGVFHLTKAMLPELRQAAVPDDPARVINIGSINGLRPPEWDSYSYSASKAAVHMLTRHLARRLAPEHITVNAIAAGPFESKMTAFILEDEQAAKEMAAEIPLGRIGEPDDVVGMTLFLASRAGAYLTGSVIPLDGGLTACT